MLRFRIYYPTWQIGNTIVTSRSLISQFWWFDNNNNNNWKFTFLLVVIYWFGIEHCCPGRAATEEKKLMSLKIRSIRSFKFQVIKYTKFIWSSFYLYQKKNNAYLFCHWKSSKPKRAVNSSIFFNSNDTFSIRSSNNHFQAK